MKDSTTGKDILYEDTTKETSFHQDTLTYFLQLAGNVSYTQAAQILGSHPTSIDSANKEIRRRTVGHHYFYSDGKSCPFSMRATLCRCSSPDLETFK